MEKMPIHLYLRTNDAQYSDELSHVFQAPQFRYFAIGMSGNIDGIFASRLPDVVILDEITPDNVALSKALYTMDSSLPVIFVTSRRTTEKIRQDSLEARAVDYISKSSKGRHDYLKVNVQLRGERHQNILRQHQMEQDLAGKVHDVRAILSTIYIASAQIGEDLKPQFMDIIRRKCILGLDYTESLLTRADLQDLNLDNTVRDFLKQYITPSNIEFNAELKSNSNINGDPILLSRLMANALHNAEESIDGNGLIVLETFNKNGKAVMSISDTGKGMTQEHVASVFDGGYSTKVYGHGLGAKVMRSIIEQHSIETFIKSAPDKGSTFEFRFPMRKT